MRAPSPRASPFPKAEVCGYEMGTAATRHGAAAAVASRCWPGRAGEQGEPRLAGSCAALGGERACRSVCALPPAVAKATFVFVSLWRSFAYGMRLLWGLAINIFISV